MFHSNGERDHEDVDAPDTLNAATAIPQHQSQPSSGSTTKKEDHHDTEDGSTTIATTEQVSKGSVNGPIEEQDDSKDKKVEEEVGLETKVVQVQQQQQQQHVESLDAAVLSSSSPTSKMMTPSKKSSLFVLTSHNHSDYKNEMVLDPHMFPNLKLGDYVEVYHPDKANRKLLQQITSLEEVRGNIQISLLKSIAKNPAFQLQIFQPVVVQKVSPEKYYLGYVEITFKDQYVSQGEFWRLKDAMVGKSCYIGQKISLCGINISVDEMLTRGNKPVACGVVDSSTKFIFRSCSARLFWLVQMSKEMWNFTEDGELYFERFLNRFVTEVFDKWTAKGVTHRLTVVYFTRTYYNRKPPNAMPGVMLDYDGRYFSDLYHNVVENETRPNWGSLKILLRREFHRFSSIAGWKIMEECFVEDRMGRYGSSLNSQTSSISGRGPNTIEENLVSDEFRKNSYRNLATFSSLKLSGGSGGSLGRSQSGEEDNDQFDDEVGEDFEENEQEQDAFGLPSHSQEGNCLEAINLCLNILDKHFMDRDLTRTGQAMVLITPGAGVFEVDRRLTNITKQRMMDNAIGCDFISLTRAPLHVAPLFVYKPSNSKMDIFDRVHPFAPSFTYRVATSAGVVEPHEAMEAKSPSSSGPPKQRSFGDLPTFMEDSMEEKPFYPMGLGTGGVTVDPQLVLSVYNIPHWIHLSFPYHRSLNRQSLAHPSWSNSPYEPTRQEALTAVVQPGESAYLSSGLETWETQLKMPNMFSVGEQFEPLPFNRMFDLANPNRSNLPIALITQIQHDTQLLEDRNGSPDQDHGVAATSPPPPHHHLHHHHSSYQSHQERRPHSHNLHHHHNQHHHHHHHHHHPRRHRVPIRGMMNPWYPLLQHSIRSESSLLQKGKGFLPFTDLRQNSPSLEALTPAASMIPKALSLEDSASAFSSSIDDDPSPPMVVAPKLKKSQGLGLHDLRKVQSFDWSRSGALQPNKSVLGGGNRGTSFRWSGATTTTQQMQQKNPLLISGETAEMWSGRLARDMQQHLEFDKKVFQRPKVTFREKNAWMEKMENKGRLGIARSTSLANLRVGNIGNSKPPSYVLRPGDIPTSNPVNSAEPLKLRSGSVLSQASNDTLDSDAADISPPPKSARKVKGHIISFLETKQNQRMSLEDNTFADQVVTSPLSTPKNADKQTNENDADDHDDTGVTASDNNHKDKAFGEVSIQVPVKDQGHQQQHRSPPPPNYHHQQQQQGQSLSSQQYKPSSVEPHGSLSSHSISSSLDQSRHLLTWDQRSQFGPGMKIMEKKPSILGEDFFKPIPVSDESPPQPPPLESTNSSSNIDPWKAIEEPKKDMSIAADEDQTMKLGPASPLQRSNRNRSMPGLRQDQFFLPAKPSGIGFNNRQQSFVSTVSNSSVPTPPPVVGQPTYIPINPFDWSVFTSSLYRERLTHNRRRWSHLFPTGRFDDEGHGIRVEDFNEEAKNTEEEEEKDEVVPLTIESFRLNWKSLQSPGILPLTTDYIPDAVELSYSYRENFYSLTLPDTPSDYGYADHEELIKEMVCQRLSQDFQLLVVKRDDDQQKNNGKSKVDISVVGDEEDGTNDNQNKGTGEGGDDDDAQQDKEQGASNATSNNDKTEENERAQSPKHGEEDQQVVEEDEEEPKGEVLRQQHGENPSATVRRFPGSTIVVGSSDRNPSSSHSRWSNSRNSSNTIVIRPIGAGGGVQKRRDSTYHQQRANARNRVQSAKRTTTHPQKQVTQATARQITKKQEIQTTYILTMGHQIHQLEYTPATYEVKVKRYVHHNFAPGAASKFSYTYMLYDSTEKITSPVSLEFTDLVPFYNWNRLDYLVCGSDEGDFSSTVRYRRNMFCVLPTNGKRESRRSRRTKDKSLRRRTYASSLENVFSSSSSSRSFHGGSSRQTPNNNTTVGTPTPSTPLSSSLSSPTVTPNPPIFGGGKPSFSIETTPSSSLKNDEELSTRRVMKRHASAAPGPSSRSNGDHEDNPNLDEDADEIVEIEGEGETASFTPLVINPLNTVSLSSRDMESEWSIACITYEEEERIVQGFEKLLSWLESKTTPHRLNISIRRRFKLVSKDKTSPPHLEPGWEVVGEYVPTSPKEKDLQDMVLLENKSMIQTVGASVSHAKVDLQSWRNTGRYEWLILQHDSIFSPYQAFHLDVQWMVAAGSSILNFVSVMSRKAKQAGLHFQQLPEYCRSTAMGYNKRVPHPFVLPKQIRFSIALDENEHFLQLLVFTLRARLDFVMDSIFKQQGKTWPSLVHKEGYAYLHLSQYGIEYLQNRMIATSTQDENTYETALQVFRDTRDICHVLDMSYQIVQSVIDDMFDWTE